MIPSPATSNVQPEGVLVESPIIEPANERIIK